LTSCEVSKATNFLIAVLWLLAILELLHFFPVHLRKSVIHLFSDIFRLSTELLFVSSLCALVFKIDLDLVLIFQLSGESISDREASLGVNTGIVSG
tara:strand:- start:699 stop:986 length:288 start_codon:yes stop_codon:yes gene_type:complete